MIHLVYTDDRGNLYDHPRLQACGRSGERTIALQSNDVIPLPEGATLTSLPGRVAVGWDRRQGARTVEEALVERGRGRVYPVGALLPQGFTRLLLPGFRKPEGAAALPLFGYTAVGMKGNGELVVAALQTDEHRKWHPSFYNTPDLPDIIEARLKREPDNRLLHHLAHCSLDYRCFTAQNVFYRRWECGLPVSPACNASCLGCISLQESECCPSPQGRIGFRPSPEEAADIAVYHLEAAEEGIISFGQGCEGEPVLQDELIAAVIRNVRRRTSSGTINMNSNAGFTAGVRRAAEAGLNSIRVSIISADPSDYAAYYRPRGYAFENVAESIDICRKHGVFVSLNLLALPGYTDRPNQIEGLVRFLEAHPANLVQLRNLNIDPDSLPDLFTTGDPGLGMPALIDRLQRVLGPRGVGNYTPPSVWIK